MYLNKVGDEEGEHGEGKAKDVEERESDKGLVRCQLVVGVVDVEKGVGSKGHQRHLRETDFCRVGHS